MSVHLVAGERLKRELERSAEQAGCTVDWMVERTRPWDSASFVGGLHELSFALGGLSRRAWLEALDEHSVYLPGFVLVRLEIGAIEERGEDLFATLEATTVKEA